MLPKAIAWHKLLKHGCPSIHAPGHGANGKRRVSAMRKLVFAAFVALVLVLLSASRAE
jgi:hypothetical protein